MFPPVAVNVVPSSFVQIETSSPALATDGIMIPTVTESIDEHVPSLTVTKYFVGVAGSAVVVALVASLKPVVGDHK